MIYLYRHHIYTLKIFFYAFLVMSWAFSSVTLSSLKDPALGYMYTRALLIPSSSYYASMHLLSCHTTICLQETCIIILHDQSCLHHMHFYHLSRTSLSSLLSVILLLSCFHTFIIVISVKGHMQPYHYHVFYSAIFNLYMFQVKGHRWTFHIFLYMLIFNIFIKLILTHIYTRNDQR